MKRLILRAVTLATCGLTAAAFLPAAAMAVEAAPQYQVSYTFDSQYEVTNLNIFNGTPSGGSIDYGFGNAYPLQPDTITSSTQTGATADDRTFIFGVTQDLPNDAAGQQHLVLFTNTTFAQNAKGIAFGTLFPNTDEDALISYLEGTPTPDGSSPTFNFAYGDAENGPNHDLAFNPGGSFTEIAFSNGQLIGVGNGVSEAIPAGGTISAAPEPSIWLLMFAGIGGIGLMLRRAKRTMGFRFKDAFSA